MLRRGIHLRGDVQEVSPLESALATTLGQGPSVWRGKPLRFMSGHFPEASMLKKAQLPACEGTGQRLCNSSDKVPTVQCQDPCMVKSKGILSFLWIIPTSGFSNLGLCMFRNGVFPWPQRDSLKANQFAKGEKKITFNFKMPKGVVLGQRLGHVCHLNIPG